MITNTRYKFKLRVYVAGPYSIGDPAENVRRAITVANDLMDKGYAVYVPHLSHFMYQQQNRDYEFWLAHDKEWLKQCEALVRIPGESSGADREVALAKDMGIPVYSSYIEFILAEEKLR